jgi:hypothetical protein
MNISSGKIFHLVELNANENCLDTVLSFALDSEPDGSECTRYMV